MGIVSRSSDLSSSLGIPFGGQGRPLTKIGRVGEMIQFVQQFVSLK